MRTALRTAAMIFGAMAASSLLRAAAPPPIRPGPPIQGPAWVAIVNRPYLSQTVPLFCATNVGSQPLNVYWVVYNTASAVPLGMVSNMTLTLKPLETGCMEAPPVPPSAFNMWLYGVTIAGESNGDVVLADLQSLLVSAQFQQSPFHDEGSSLTPVLLKSVALPGKNAP